ncbi:MAG TPA: hypothetical protein DDW94_06055 [Deltaproteobacteria bacterium]|nr:hypothetical protein [Deltaproteobacteria bacterium]HCY09941.1 hypothetical protein [Deltaproteobacteria bacterium]
MKSFDLIVIGGGVAGLVAASGAARFGAKVALIDNVSLGGDCLRTGCVPTKRLVQSAKVASLLRRSEEFGILKRQGRGGFQEGNGVDEKDEGQDSGERRPGALQEDGHRGHLRAGAFHRRPDL